MDLNVNGSIHRVEVPAGTTLLSVLREELQLLGTRYGCGHGVCGACYVLVDGDALPACKLDVQDLPGRRIRTIEGIAAGGRLHRVQQCFLRHDAMQCGYCTSGMIVSAVALLGRNPRPSEEQIRAVLAHHLCRCGVYLRAVRAVAEAAT